MGTPTDSDSDPLGSSDEIRLSNRNVAVPWPKRAELMRRLDRAGQKQAAEDLRFRRMFTETQKPAVYEVLNLWLDDVGVDEFGEHLMLLRGELERDINPTP